MLGKARQLAAHEPQVDIRVRLLAEVGAACAETGHATLAEEVFRQAAADAENADDRDTLLAILTRTCADAGLYHLARQCAAGIGLPGNRAAALLDAAGEAAAGEAAEQVEPLIQDAVNAILASRSIAGSVRRLARAAVICADAGLTAKADELLEEARRPTTGEAAAPLAIAHCVAGQPDQARALFTEMQQPPARAVALLKCAGALLDRERPDEASGFMSEALGMREELNSAAGITTVLDAAAGYGRSGHVQAAKSLLETAERIGAEIGLESGQRRRLEYLYGELGLWMDAARIAREDGKTGQVYRYEIKALLARARRGEAEAAFEDLLALDGEYASYVGLQLLGDIYELYLSQRPDASLSELAALSPLGSEYVAVQALAEAAVRRGNYEAVIPLLEKREKVPATQSIVADTASYALQQSGPEEAEEAIALAEEMLDALTTTVRYLRILYQIGTRAMQAGHRDRARSVAERILAKLATANLNDQEARQLVQIAILENWLGRPDRAQELISTALPRAQEIGCDSCRIEVLQGIFDDLRAADARDLLLAALEETHLSETLLEQSLTTLRALSGLSESDARRLLRMALDGALRRGRQEQRVRAVLQVASAYRQVGVAPGSRALAILAEAPLEPGRRTLGAQESPEELIDRLNGQGSAPVSLAFFTDETCPECARAKGLLEEVKKSLTGPDLTISEYDLDASAKNAHMNKALCSYLRLPSEFHGKRPAVFSSAGALFGDEITEANVLALISAARYKPSPEEIYNRGESQGSATKDLRKEYEALAFTGVVVAGLADGVNPCAFTVIIFLLSYLTLVGKDRHQVLAVGAVFAVAVFLTYFAAGLGLSQVVARLKEISQVVRIVLYGAAAALLLVAAVLSFRDAWLCANGKSDRMALSLPDGLKSRIRRKISRQTRMGLTVGGTALLGVVVALFELPCTGQVYIPIILALHDLPQHFWGPVGWLLLYNLCFIVPLLMVIGAVFCGLTSEKLTDLFRRHVAKTKLALGTAFLLLCALMLTLIFWKPV